ncbi:hypothetical protein GH5_07504 [Leishmania sp. Ghana 2012 LV757]|uniref:hypothetical protein n=1 Tax=Leishmania sp. Ghana 2012 LV757 TaxID=2803181 RepID=UPI001B5B814D|nr:hypothetical protein GH5_07504 [Leishmania sp. Ghana 2012 LV757]
MDLADKSMWTLVEEAVIEDRGEDEEEVLAQMVRSYLARRGLADTLAAFDEEHLSYGGSLKFSYTGDRDAPKSSTSTGVLDSKSTAVGASLNGGAPVNEASAGMEKRKAAQLLCLQKKYEAAAALMEPSSLARIRLLCIQAQSLEDRAAAVFYLATHVAPLVPFCSDPTVGHRVYTAALSEVLSPCRERSIPDTEALAREVNDELCGREQRSSLHVLFNWAYWQETAHTA